MGVEGAGRGCTKLDIYEQAFCKGQTGGFVGIVPNIYSASTPGRAISHNSKPASFSFRPLTAMFSSEVRLSSIPLDPLKSSTHFCPVSIQPGITRLSQLNSSKLPTPQKTVAFLQRCLPGGRALNRRPKAVLPSSGAADLSTLRRFAALPPLPGTDDGPGRRWRSSCGLDRY